MNKIQQYPRKQECETTRRFQTQQHKGGKCVLSSGVHRGAPKWAKENNSLFMKSGQCCIRGGLRGWKPGEWSGRARERLPNVYTFPQVICIVRWETISTQSCPPQQDYRDKIEPEWSLHSSNGDLWTNFWGLTNFKELQERKRWGMAELWKVISN